MKRTPCPSKGHFVSAGQNVCVKEVTLPCASDKAARSEATESASSDGERLQPRMPRLTRLREIDVAQADFVGLRFARPAEAFFGHATILLGRYHHALQRLMSLLCGGRR